MSAELITEKHGAATAIFFNRPEHQNAFTPTMANLLFQALKPITTSHGIRAVLLSGKGGHFMKGLDLSAIYGTDFNQGQIAHHQMLQPYHSAIRELYAMEKPVIAAVQGAVGGPGLSLMMACDLIVAARDTVFNFEFSSYGLSSDGAASYHLARRVGVTKANELLMLSENFSAEDALKYGLINRVVDNDKLMDEGLALTERLANGPTKAYGAIRKAVAKAFEQDQTAALALENTLWGACSRSFDFRDVIKARNAKREVKFSGA